MTTGPTTVTQRKGWGFGSLRISFIAQLFGVNVDVDGKSCEMRPLSNYEVRLMLLVVNNRYLATHEIIGQKEEMIMFGLVGKSLLGFFNPTTYTRPGLNNKCFVHTYRTRIAS